jgi:hypothetical protein
MAPYQLALNAASFLVKEVQLEEINKTLNRIEDKLDTLIRIEFNKPKYKTRSILTFIEERMEYLVTNSDLSRDRQIYLNYLEFFESYIPILLEEIDYRFQEINDFKTREVYFGSKARINKSIQLKKEFELISENILLMIKFVPEKLNYSRKMQNLRENVRFLLNKYYNYHLLYRLARDRPFIALPSTSNFYEEHHEEYFELLMKTTPLEEECKRLNEILESYLTKSSPETLYSQTFRKKIELELDGANNVEKVRLVVNTIS